MYEGLQTCLLFYRIQTRSQKSSRNNKYQKVIKGKPKTLFRRLCLECTSQTIEQVNWNILNTVHI